MTALRGGEDCQNKSAKTSLAKKKEKRIRKKERALYGNKGIKNQHSKKRASSLRGLK